MIRSAASTTLDAGRRPALVPVEPDDQRDAAEHGEDEEPLRPRLLEADVGADRLAGARGATPSRSASLWRIQSVTLTVSTVVR